MRTFVDCPKLKSNGKRSTEICYKVCKFFNRCTVVHNIYLQDSYSLTIKKGKPRGKYHKKAKV